MTPLRVLIVTRALPFHQIGGMEAVAWDLARGLSEDGCSVRVLTMACPRLPEMSVQGGVAVECLPVPTGRYSRQWARLSRDAYLSRYEPATDVVLSVSAAAFPLLRQKRAAESGPVFVMQAHGTSWSELRSKLRRPSPIAWAKGLRNVQGLVSDRMYQKFDALVAVGDAVQADLRHLPTRLLTGGVPQHLIRNGIDETRFRFDPEARHALRHELGADLAQPIVVTAARLHAQKGVRESLLAVAQAMRSQPDLLYVIVGDGPEAASLREAAAALGVASRVRFLGALPRPELARYLSAADMFLFTSLRREAGPTLSILEALASGLPCIVSRELHDPALGTIGVTANAAEEVAGEIFRLAAQPAAARRSRLPPELSLSASARAYHALFQSLVAGRGAKEMRPASRMLAAVG